MKYTRKCKCCGKEFQTNSPQKLFCDDVHYLPCPVCGKPVFKKDRDFTRPPKCCSSECTHILRKQHMKTKICEICGEEFTPTSGVATICNKEHHIKCEICGKDMIVTKDMWHDGIRTCSDECRKEKTRRFNQEKYGVDHPMQSKEVQQHHKDSMKEKYGVEFALQSEEFLNKASDTTKERYGVEWAQQNPEIKEKSYRTMEERYGGRTTYQSPILRKKITETNLKKYGVENPIQSQLIKDKIAAINIERYGFPNPNQAKEIYTKGMQTRIRHFGEMWPQEIRDKCKQTWMEHYGVDNPFKSNQIKEKIAETNIKKYGVPNPNQCPEIRDKIRATSIERYGVPCYLQLPESKNYGIKISVVNRTFGQLLEDNGIEYTYEFPIGMKSYDIKISHNDILIEIDPSYSHTCQPDLNHWHSSLDSSYHINKTMIAEEAGYRCIHVFDWDDWAKIVQLIKPKTAVYARKCTLQKIGTKVADDFTTKYHMQGKCRGQVDNYGLYYEGELVEVMTFGKPRYTKKYDYELLRLCTKDDVRVVGGASKLFKAFIRDHSDISVISYCDLSKFTGKVYEEIGMKLHHITEPAKVWSRGLDKITDNLLRQRGFDQLFGTNYGKGTSNEALMIEDGWMPVYDCGQLVFEYRV